MSSTEWLTALVLVAGLVWLHVDDMRDPWRRE